MAEALPAFVARRRADWDALEAALPRFGRGTTTLREVSELERLYRRVSADLATAQAFYPGTDAHRFLNQLAAKAYGTVYRQRPARVAALRAFFREGFPRAVRESLPYTKLAAALMVLGVVVGATTVALEPNGALLLVPEGLREWIGRKELWTDQALVAHTPSEMATAIFVNNLRVTIAAFALGITFGLGTALLLLVNGLHLGAVLAACIQEGLGPGILSFMAAHGPVELSIIAITGGAGLKLGHALLEPGERPRAEVLREKAPAAVQLVLGCAPFLTGIGVVEGFVSPGTFFPWWVKLPLGVALGVGFWMYVLRGGRAVDDRA